MSKENVDLVRAIYDAWTSKTSASHLIAPDLEYVNLPYAVERYLDAGDAAAGLSE